MAVEYETLVQGGHSKFAEEIFKKIAPVEEESDEGNPITIVTDSAQIAKNTHLTFEPIQDLHGYDHPWPAGGGKNLLPPFTNNSAGGLTLTVDSEGVCTVNGTRSDSEAGLLGNQSITLSAGSYTLSDGTDNINAMVQIYNATTGTIIWRGGDTLAFTHNGTDDLRARVWVRGATTYSNVKLYPMIRKSTDSAEWEPYSNICPISGLDEVEVKRTGFNLWDEQWEVGAYSTGNGHKTDSSTTIRTANKIPLIAGATYYVKYSITTNIRWFFYDSAGTYLSTTLYGTNQNCTFPSDARYATFHLTATTYNHDICINISDPDKNGTYEPYQGQEVTESLPTTVYGGMLDWETGELVVDMALMDIGAEFAYARITSYANPFFQTTLSTADENKTSLTTIYKYGSFSEVVANDKTYTIVSNTVRIRDDDYDDATVFRNAMRGQKIAFHLKTPITYTLTPKQLSLLKGTNHISTNAKSVKVTFRAGQLATLEDVAGAVKIADEHLETALTPILGDFATVETSPASASHAVGEYLIYNKRLYKVLSSISAGQQLTIGTNVGQTNVAAELASQANAISALNSNWVYLNSSDYASHEAYLRAIVSVTSAYKPYIVSSKTSGSPLQIGMFIKKDDNNAEILLAHDSGIRMYYLNNNTFSEYTCAKKSD